MGRTATKKNEPETAIAKMPRRDQERSAVALIEFKNRAYAKDPWLWACEQVWTVDEATQQKLRWPSEKTYLQELLQCIQEEQMVIIPKSRRMLVSWSVCLWTTHQARYFEHHHIMLQSENEDKAAYLTDKRCAFIEDNLEEPVFRRPYNSWKTKQGSIGKIVYPGTQSTIEAVPQGGHVVRTPTLSALVMDESEFQQQGRQALTAALPLIEEGKNVKLILMSSSNGPVGVIAAICREVGFVRFI